MSASPDSHDPSPPPALRAWKWTAALVILLSAFLLFQVQPLISRIILPWFGGSPAVWTTCMLFFQTLLLAGYAYAHGVSQLRPRQQWLAHAALLLLACLLLPISPDDAWKPSDSTQPTMRILWLLAAHVGLPYFLLSSTGPLVQSWYSQTAPGSPYRLYSVSNAGSLAALLTYPIVFEPLLAVSRQAMLWSVSFVVFAIFCAELARRFSSRQYATPPTPHSRGSATPWRRLAAWVLLPAIASCALLAVTARISQDVAVSPFMWVAPLSLYLLTFIICFDHERWHRRLPMAVLLAFAVLAVCLVMLADEIEQVYNSAGIPLNIGHFDNNLVVESTTGLTMLFLLCMVCHGEVVRMKPPPAELTKFYLAIAAGGAMGGIFVGILCPLLFSFVAEWHLSLLAAFAVAALVTLQSLWQYRGAAKLGSDSRAAKFGSDSRAAKKSRSRRSKPDPPEKKSDRAFWNLVFGGTALCMTAAGLIVAWAQFMEIQDGSLHRARSFYGVLSVKVFQPDDEASTARVLYSGRIMHGYQRWSPDQRGEPTTYYDRQSGVGVALASLASGPPLRVGIVGLGAGTLATYAREGDLYKFYEINPLCIDFAQEHFAFLSDSAGATETVLGDARILLENEPPQDFDVLVLDAFSGDAIPIHLLTREAMMVYDRHLQEDGLLCVHISNRHLNLTPIVGALAKDQGFATCRVEQPRGGGMEKTGSDWVILSRDPGRLQSVQETANSLAKSGETPIRSMPQELKLWTDDHSNLLDALH